MRYTEAWVTSGDGRRLFVRHYSRPQTPQNRTIFLVHGAAEHGARYRHVVDWFLKRNWNVVIDDHRGHGLSDGVPMHLRHFDQYLNDQRRIQEHLGIAPHQCVRIGHSMGGLITARLAQADPELVPAFILSSPLLGIRVPIPPHTKAVGRVLSWVVPKTRFRTPIQHEDVSRSQDVVDDRRADVLLHRSVTAGWFFAIQSALRTVWDQANQITQPFLILQAGEDRIVDPDAPEQWLPRTSSTDRTFHKFPGCFHELHSEPEWELILGTVSQWLEERWKPTGFNHADVTTRSAA
ncbi:alpha/beta hydrolase [Thalassoroseus pseudoceratinae]|uniref:alpha/beta hydrolase n=1 Tax=Thalassoroseus pseudoceratinae TaxID=2713176 RepID=UPI00141E2038|nr:alpha/beta hydrolase [Thalassoroseus pseudoceratinae]